jgi:hypothetical protein
LEESSSLDSTMTSKVGRLFGLTASQFYNGFQRHIGVAVEDFKDPSD